MEESQSAGCRAIRLNVTLTPHFPRYAPEGRGRLVVTMWWLHIGCGPLERTRHKLEDVCGGRQDGSVLSYAVEHCKASEESETWCEIV